MKRFAALLAVLLALAPGVYAQSDTFTASGWTPDATQHDETWDVTASGALDAPSEVAESETRLTRQTPDGTEQHLTARVGQARQDLSDAYFRSLQHNALGQTPITVGEGAFGWRERDMATAAARTGNVVQEVHLDGVTDADPVDDEQIAGWLASLVQQPPPAPIDWTQVLANQPHAWQFLLDKQLVGGDWQQDAGLELHSQEQGGQVQSLSASREFSQSGAIRRSVTSMATVFAAADAAGGPGMQAEGTKIDAPRMGDASAAFRQLDSGDGDAPTVTYTVNVRRGLMVMSTQETGVIYSLDSPDEVFGMAAALDSRAAQLLTQ